MPSPICEAAPQYVTDGTQTISTFYFFCGAAYPHHIPLHVACYTHKWLGVSPMLLRARFAACVASLPRGWLFNSFFGAA